MYMRFIHTCRLGYVSIQFVVYCAESSHRSGHNNVLHVDNHAQQVLHDEVEEYLGTLDYIPYAPLLGFLLGKHMAVSAIDKFG